MCQDLLYTDAMEVDSTYYSDSDSVVNPAFQTVSRIHQTSILHKLPVEVFGQICSSLDPIWLLNLSQTCHRVREQLSLEHGNQIWYNSLPSSVWKDAEHYQDETELHNLLASQGSPERFASEMVVDFMYRGPSSNPFNPYKISPAFSSYGQSSLGSHIAPPLFIHANNTRTMPNLYSGYDLSPTQSDHGGASTAFSSAALNGRRHVQALGGPYQPVFNYKREIIGYLETAQRCYICLNLTSATGEVVDNWHWAILFCNECLKQYTITSGILGRLVYVPELPLLLKDVTLQPYDMGSSKVYYRPEIDDLFRNATGVDVATQVLKHKACQQMLKKERVGRSRLEGKRRIVRCLIVAAAELLWDGYDPSPDEITDSETGEFTGWQPREGMNSAETYRAFRDRFAPTHKLWSFLFADSLLDQFPSRLAYNPATGWMEDPTMALRKNDDFETLTERWVADSAFGMLEKLTDWRHNLYYYKGYGGYVSNWTEAAIKYHVHRMESHLKTGATVNLALVPIELRGVPGLRRLRKLRVKCGLQDELSAGLRPLPQRPERGGFVTRYSFDEYVRLDQCAAAAELERADAIKFFNKIIRRTCVGCPESGYLFYPMGFEGLVEHMRFSHPRRFWTKDDFETIG